MPSSLRALERCYELFGLVFASILLLTLSACDQQGSGEEVDDRYADADNVFYVELDVKGTWAFHDNQYIRVRLYEYPTVEVTAFMTQTLSRPDFNSGTPHCTERFIPPAPQNNSHLVNVVAEFEEPNSIWDFTGYWSDGTFNVQTSFGTWVTMDIYTFLNTVRYTHAPDRPQGHLIVSDFPSEKASQVNSWTDLVDGTSDSSFFLGVSKWAKTQCFFGEGQENGNDVWIPTGMLFYDATETLADLVTNRTDLFKGIMPDPLEIRKMVVGHELLHQLGLDHLPDTREAGRCHEDSEPPAQPACDCIMNEKWSLEHVRVLCHSVNKENCEIFFNKYFLSKCVCASHRKAALCQLENLVWDGP